MNSDLFDVFERLKRKKSALAKQLAVDTVFFQLCFDHIGAFVRVIDHNQKEIEPGYEYYRGATRSLLKSIANIRDRQAFRIDWDIPRHNLYLAENEYLIWQLQHCPNFVDNELSPIQFVEGLGKLILLIEEKDEVLHSKIILNYQGEVFTQLQFINENHVFVANKVIQIQPLSENFKDIHLFETRLLPANFENFLSLLYSHFDQISVSYQDYKVVAAPPKETQPTIIFERVDPDNSLYLKVTSSLIGFNPNFLDDYEITKVASLNDLEQKIVVSEVQHTESYSCFEEISKLLKKYSQALTERKEFYTAQNLFIIEENLAKEFIQKELTHLISRYTIFGAEKLRAYRIRTVRPNLNLALSYGVNFLEGDVTLEIEGYQLSLFDVLSQYKKNSYITLSDGTSAIINKDYIKKLQRVFKKQKDKVRISFFDLPIVEELIDEKVAQESFPQSREIFLGFNDIEKAEVTFPQLNTALRNYQKNGYKWIDYLHRHRLGGCLADDMGLGKTVQAIALLASIYPAEATSSLIVMPRSLLFNWENEIKKFKPELTYYVYHGNQRDLTAARQKHLVLTTYATVRIDLQKLKEEPFYYIILDESQNIKNINSQVFKAVMLLESHHRLALSGTPIENNLTELYALFRFLNPAMFGSVEEFNHDYAQPIQRANDKDVLHELKKKIYPFILRRLKREVLQDLPEKIEQTLFVEMSAQQKLLYEQRRAFYHQMIFAQIGQHGIKKSQIYIFNALSELRQLASIPEAKSENGIISPKRELLQEHIIDVIANNHKVLVFANFLAALDGVAEDLEQLGIEYLMMTGSTRDRKRLVDLFQNDETYKVFLMTLKTGGLGLNLTAADYIFIFDPWWNLAAENQAIDRTHRIGQDKTVFSYKLITRGTIEEKILTLQEKKRELFDNLYQRWCLDQNVK